MQTSKGRWRGALTCLVAFGVHGSTLAQAESESPEATAAIEARARDTNKSLLEALIERRAEVERAAGTDQDKRAVLGLLDKRIAELKSRLEEADIAPSS